MRRSRKGKYFTRELIKLMGKNHERKAGRWLVVDTHRCNNKVKKKTNFAEISIINE